MKIVKFTNDKLINEYQTNYSRNDSSFISGCDSDFSKKIGFIIDALFNDEEGTVIKNLDISESILEDNQDIDAIWVDSTKQQDSNIFFLKWLNICPDKTSELNENFKKTSKKVIEYLNKLANKNDTNEELQLIENIITQTFDFNEYDEIDFFYIYFVIQDNGKKITDADKKLMNKNFKLILENELSSNNVVFKNIETKLFFEKDIHSSLIKKQGAKICIQKGEFKLDSDKNYLTYKIDDENIDKSIICNISAKSIFKLWQNYENNLLSLNLRLHIKNKKIDDKMNDSMSKAKNKFFWFKNNGLVIICESFEINNNSLIANNFSIINGGQTTYNIGNNSEDFFVDNDFFVCAKIISVRGMNDKPLPKIYELTNEIAEATNNQKPIKNADLIANLPILKEVKQLFLDDVKIKMFIQTRRGETPTNKSEHFPEKYQITTAEQLLQIYYSFHCIAPGTSRNGKTNIYSKAKNIEEAFTHIKNNYNIYNELVILFYLHSNLKTKKSLNKYFFGKLPASNFVKFGQYFLLASIQLLFIFSNNQEKSIDLKNIIYSYQNDKLQERVVEWIQKEFHKLKIKQILKYSLTKNNIDQYIAPFYINLINDTFAFIDQKAYDSFNKNGDNIISNFSKTNGSFYIFFIIELIDKMDKETTKKSFKDFFNLGN